MAFFFSKKPESVAQDLATVSDRTVSDRDGAPASDVSPTDVGPTVQSPVRAASTQIDAFSVEMLGHLDTLYGVASRMTRSSTEAEDLVQDTIVKAMRARDQFQPGTNLKAWLLRIQTNTFINRYRRGGMERDLFDGPDADPLADGWVGASTMRAIRDPESQALSSLVEGELTRALDELPDDFRLAVVLSDVEELSYKEIAEVMGCPIGTVMSRLHRGRKLLQVKLRDQAIAMGIIDENAQADAESVRAPTDINEYRSKRRAV